MHFRDLNEAQVLALAGTAEEDAHIYRDFAESPAAESAECVRRIAADTAPSTAADAPSSAVAEKSPAVAFGWRGGSG
ncbi:MAG: hypothetical protein ABI946_00120 [Chthoniobacterales bacterium]